MAVECKNCGGNCTPLGDGSYRCKFCGEVYSANEFAAPKSNNPSNMSETTGTDVFESNIGGVLEIQWCTGGNSYCAGSGLLIDRNGYAITNAHVVTYDNGASCGTCSVRIADEKVTASVVALGDNKHGSGSGDDLALIKLNRVPSRAKVLEFADFSSVRVGEQVFVIGNSLGAGTCITAGIVSDRLRSVQGKQLLMTDCAVNGGNSGGPMFNAKGKVIGVIVSGITGAEGMNFAIPSDTVRRFINRYM